MSVFEMYLSKIVSSYLFIRSERRQWCDDFTDTRHDCFLLNMSSTYLAIYCFIYCEQNT